jgi:hypothetical protein
MQRGGVFANKEGAELRHGTLSISRSVISLAPGNSFLDHPEVRKHSNLVHYLGGQTPKKEEKVASPLQPSSLSSDSSHGDGNLIAPDGGPEDGAGIGNGDAIQNGVAIGQGQDVAVGPVGVLGGDGVRDDEDGDG